MADSTITQRATYAFTEYKKNSCHVVPLPITNQIILFLTQIRLLFLVKVSTEC